MTSRVDLTPSPNDVPIRPDPADRPGALISSLRLRYMASLRYGDVRLARDVVSEAIRSGLTQNEIFVQILTPGMEEVGRLWEHGALDAGLEHLASAITLRRIDELAIGAPEAPERAACVLFALPPGETHFLGLRMAAEVGRASGYDTLLFTTAAAIDELVAMVATTAPLAVGISISRDETVPVAERVVAAVRAAVPRQPILLAGGAAATIAKALGCDLSALRASGAQEADLARVIEPLIYAGQEERA